LRSRPTAEKAEANAGFIKDVLPLFEAGKIRPNLDKIFPVENVRQAHERLESNQSFGKVILEF
jgi:NADPH:quinone reductase-like Zn-dependent oxidoreductase